MPTTIEGVEYFTAAEVRSDFVPKAAHLDRLAAKDKAVKAAEAKVLDLSTSLREASTATERLQALQGESAQERDNAALRSAGLDPAADSDISWLRMAHKHHIESLPEDKRPDDLGADFRQWVQSEDGAKSHRHTSHLFKAPEAAATEAATADAAPTPPAAGNIDRDQLLQVLAAAGVKVPGVETPEQTPARRAAPVTTTATPAPGQRTPVDPRSVQRRLRAIMDNTGLDANQKRAEVAKVRAELSGG